MRTLGLQDSNAWTDGPGAQVIALMLKTGLGGDLFVVGEKVPTEGGAKINQAQMLLTRAGATVQISDAGEWYAQRR